MDDRIIKLIGEEALDKIKNTSVLLIGVGGVGGFILENLVRSGFTNITIVDGDVVETSNLNRQIISNAHNIGDKKVFVARDRAISINPNIQIQVIDKFLLFNDIDDNFVKSYDYIIDACDTVSVKIALIRVAKQSKKRIISCMGTANRMNPGLLKIKKLKDTFNDPLAKVLRHELRSDKDCLNTYVLCSEENPLKQRELGTLAMVPMAAASLICYKVIDDVIQ